ELLAIEGITTEDLTEAAADGGIIFKPGSIESTGVPVSDSTSLDVGQCLQVKWGEKWWAAEVISLEDDGWVGIHYVGWTETHDEIVPRSDLQLDPEAAAKVSGTDAARALIFEGIADRAIKRKISEAFDLNAQR
ncbi:MAG: hypothetical protein ACR2RV_26245, partial [Verrucomicrobiales bacterium]